MIWARCSKRWPRHEPWPAVVSRARRVFVFRQAGKDAIDRLDNFGEARFFAGAQMRARMQNEKRQLELVRPHQFFRKGANASWRGIADWWRRD